MQVHYLEIVTNEVDAVCAEYARRHGVQFGAGVPGLGGARTAALAGGGLIGVRPPMHHTHQPHNQSLQLLGVSAAGTDSDEFDAVGLGAHRHTEKWTSPTA